MLQITKCLTLPAMSYVKFQKLMCCHVDFKPIFHQKENGFPFGVCVGNFDPQHGQFGLLISICPGVPNAKTQKFMLLPRVGYNMGTLLALCPM